MLSVKIESYNKKLLEENKNIDIISYIKYVAKNIYVINISFMDDLLELIIKDDINIHHNKLVEFGILKLNRGTTDIKNIIKQNEFIENEDVRVRNVSESASSGGCTHKNEYYFHPDAFEIILMRSKNKKEYAKYYNLCQKCIKHHSNYQLELKQSEVSRLIDEQKETNKKLRETKLELRESNKKLDKTNNKLFEIKDQNEELLDKVDNLENDNYIIKTKLNISTEERVVNPINKSKLENLIVFKNNNENEDYKYYVCRIQEKYTKVKISRLKKDNYLVILKINNITNGVKFWNHCKEKLKNNLTNQLNNFNLIHLSEDVFIKKMNEYYENRKNIELSDESESEE